MSNFEKNGRLGNQLFQLFFLKILQINFPFVEISHPHWSYSEFFNYKSSYIDIKPDVIVEFNFEDSINRGLNLELKQLEEILHEHPKLNFDITGYFQYHSLQLSRYRNLFYNTLSLKDIFEKEVSDSLKNLFNGEKFIGLHYRSGDFTAYKDHDYFWKTPKESITSTLYLLKNTFHRINLPLFVASDAPDEISNILNDARINFYTHSDLTINNYNLPSEIIDFIALTLSNQLLISNSSFSFAAALLNKTASYFFRPIPRDLNMKIFNPWNSPITIAANR